jgi:hypothetical protein
LEGPKTPSKRNFANDPKVKMMLALALSKIFVFKTGGRLAAEPMA